MEARLMRIEALLAELQAAATKPLDLGEAAAYLRQSKSHVYKLTSQGLIAHYKPTGKRIYFLKSDLDRYLLRNRRAGADEIEAAAASHLASRPATSIARSHADRRGRSQGETRAWKS